ncbi:MAG TPA: hypothetical protein VK050_08235 [Flavobacteriaceae bacterium]|nr:hypothetical protein [Flavobacteriaceae bacterium]
MNVLCIGYYDKFSRLFLGVKKHFKTKHPTAYFTIDSMYLSGYLYTLIRGQKGSWLSQKAWRLAKKNKNKYKAYLANSHKYKNFDLNKLTSSLFNSKYHKKEDELLWHAMAYIDILEQKLIEVDLLLLIGDSRLPFEIVKEMAESLQIKTYHIEQGPYNTTIFDKKGVNANLSVRGYTPKIEISKEDEKLACNTLNLQKNKKYLRNPIYRGLDYFIEFAIMKSSIYPPDLKIDFSILNKRNLTSDNKQFKATEHSGKNIFLFACQVPFDVNITHHSPYFKKHSDILKEIYFNLPKNSILLVREHPIYKSQYEEDFYTFIRNNERVYLDKDLSLNQALDIVNVVIIVNSTVGLEAITKNKSVLVLGNSYYDSSNICKKYSSEKNMQDLLVKALNYTPNKSAVLDFINYLHKKSLIPGFITDKGTALAHQIANKIILDLEK